MLGSLVLYLKGMRRMMFQVSGFYYKVYRVSRFLGFRVLGFRFRVQGLRFC